MNDEPESFEQFAERVNKLPEAEKHSAIYRLSLTWDFDWEIIYKFVYMYYEKKTHEECEELRKEYIAQCTKTLVDAFGYAGIFNTMTVEPERMNRIHIPKF
jgi:hypothetical protein